MPTNHSIMAELVVTVDKRLRSMCLGEKHCNRALAIATAKNLLSERKSLHVCPEEELILPCLLYSHQCWFSTLTTVPHKAIPVCFKSQFCKILLLLSAAVLQGWTIYGLDLSKCSSLTQALSFTEDCDSNPVCNNKEKRHYQILPTVWLHLCLGAVIKQ